MIKAIGMEKKYDTGFRVSDLDIEIEKGEITGLVGENGCGKTTLIKCLCGIYQPTKGKALCDEKKIYDTPESKEKIAYVSDSQEMLPFYSVKRIGKLYEKMYEGFDPSRFEELKEQFGLSDRQNVSDLSKGQKMALHFSLAIARKADYLIMDEPLSGLDMKKVQLVQDILLNTMEKQNPGILISSHDLDELETLCDKFIFMKEGRVVMQGSIQQIQEKVGKWQAVLYEEQKKALESGEEVRWKESFGREHIFYLYGMMRKRRTY